MSAAPLALERVSHAYGPVEALTDVTLELRSASVTCLLGDNGAGKSTLIRILSGALAPSAGRILVDGDAAHFGSPRAARALGIETVYQDLALAPLLSVWRNFFLGREPTRGRGVLRRLDPAVARRVATEELGAFGIALRDAEQPVGTLSGGQRQALAIARAVHAGARVLVLDEPTAALGVQQAARVLEHLRRARDRDVAVLLVTHNPRHALEVGDVFAVLRRGHLAGVLGRGDVDEARLVALMQGSA